MKYTGAVTFSTLLIALLLGCTPAATDENGQEEQMATLEAAVAQLASTITVQESLSDSAIEERLALQVQIGELARRIAEDEFNRFGGQEKGLLGFEAALQLCLKVIEQQPDQSYVLEDIVFLPDFASYRPDSQIGPVWQFAVRGPSGRFVVTIDASSGELVFVNRVSEAD